MKTITAAEKARLAFVAYCAEIGSHHVTEEDAILNIGREFLPAHAIAALDKTSEGTAEYYEWLLSQTEEAQAVHAAEYAAGHEWSK